MDYKKEVKKELETILGETREVRMEDVNKNNITLTGITLVGDESVYPTVYLENYIPIDKEQIDVREIAKRIIRDYEKIEQDTFYESIKEDIPKYDISKVICTLVNKDANKDLLEKAPHTIIEDDIAVIYRQIVSEEEEGGYSFIVQNDYLRACNITLEELDKRARENTRVLMPLGIRVLTSPFGSMDIVSNEANVYGAVAMLYEDLLEQYCLINGIEDVFIIPSSIHEVIFLPNADKEDIEFIASMITGVNEDVVDVRDRLSNNLYAYNVGGRLTRVSDIKKPVA